MSICLLTNDKTFVKYYDYVMSNRLLMKINTLLNNIIMLISCCLLYKDKYFAKYCNDVNVKLFTDEDKYFVKYYNEVMSICLLTKINTLLNII